MPYKITSLVLVALLLHGSIVAQDQSQLPVQTAAKMQQVLHKALEKNKAVKVTLRKASDHQKTFDGFVGDISDKGFVLSDEKTQTTRSFTYEEVQQVKQKGMSKGAKFLIIGLVVVGGLIAMGFAVACNVEGGPHC
jgi:hypothetical protein